MPPVKGLRISVQEGDSFYLNDQQVRVIEQNGPFHFKLCVVGEGAAFDNIVEVGPRHRIEVIPEVFVCAANKINEREDTTKVSIVINAPQKIKILREELYLESLTRVEDV